MGQRPQVVTVMVYGGFTTPGFGTGFIILTYRNGRVPWAKEILPAVARLVQPWFPKVKTQRIVRRKKTPNGCLYWRETVERMPSLRAVMNELYVDASLGPAVRGTKRTWRYVWDKKLEEDTSV